MASPDIQRKALIFIIVAGVAIAALAALPFVEHWLQTDFFPRLGWVFESNWQLTKDSAAGSMMATTYVGLLEHFFRLLKIVLAMTLVVAIVRFFAHLIFGR